MITINPNNDNGTICLKIPFWDKTKYIPDSLTDYEIVKFLGFSHSVKVEEIDSFIEIASQWGFDVHTFEMDNKKKGW